MVLVETLWELPVAVAKVVVSSFAAVLAVLVVLVLCVSQQGRAHSVVGASQ